MAFTGKVMASPVKTGLEVQIRQTGMPIPPVTGFFWTDFSIRLVLLSSSAASLAMVLSSKQTKLIYSPFLPAPLSLDAKFTYASAITYATAATTAVCLYGILSAAAAIFFAKRSPSTRLLLLLAFFDTLMATVMGSATGAASSIAYLALKGNSHVGWHKVCDVFDKFCRHMGSSIALDLVASVLLVTLAFNSIYSLYRRGR